MVSSNQIILKSSVEVNQYSLITVYICEPSEKPSKAAEITARPYEFSENGKAIRYQTMCPFCAQGFDITAEEITHAFGLNFIACKSCERGCKHITIVRKPELPAFIDPFISPFSNGLAASDMDEGLCDTLPIADDKTVADKLGSLDELCAESSSVAE